jgi:TctA family transporter
MNLPGESLMTCTATRRHDRDGARPALVFAAVGSLAAGYVGTLPIALFGPPPAELAFALRAGRIFLATVVALVSTAAPASKPLR